MQAYVEGDVSAFQRLFSSLSPAIHAFFKRSARDPAAADDLTQTTFLKLHDARRSWQRGRRLRPWVFSIAANVRNDWLRRQGRFVTEPIEDDELPVEGAGIDPVVESGGRERDERVRAALDSLPELQRVVVHLHRFEGLGFSDIGRILGISEGAAKLRAFRAYRVLRRRLADLAEEPT